MEELDFTSEDSRKRCKQLIIDSLKSNEDKDIEFIGKLIYVILENVVEQQIINDKILSDLNQLLKNISHEK